MIRLKEEKDTKHMHKNIFIVFIFHFLDLPYGSLAMSFGLLKMPKMPELKTWKMEGFVVDKSFVLNNIKYK